MFTVGLSIDYLKNLWVVFSFKQLQVKPFNYRFLSGHMCLLLLTKYRDHTETETELCLGVSWGGTGQQWAAAGTGALGAADLGMAWGLLEEVAINPTIELPEFTEDWEIDSWKAQTETCEHQDPRERSSDPTRDWPRLACECPGVSSGGVRWWWPAAGLGALSVAVHAWDLLRKVTIIFITSTIVWPQVYSREGTQLHPSIENWIKDLLSMALPIRPRPGIPLSQSFPSGSFHKPLILLR